MKRSIFPLAIVLAAFIANAPFSFGQTASEKRVILLPGQRPDGSVLLPNQWSLRPAGRQIPVFDFPISMAVHPSGRYAAVLHAGYSQHEIAVLDVKAERVASRRRLNETFYGIAFSSDGNKVFCSGAGAEVIHVFTFESGSLIDPRNISIRPVKERGIPAGLALSRSGRELFVANVWGQSVSRVTLGVVENVIDLPLGIAAPNPRISPSSNADLAAANKRAEAAMDVTSTNAPFPFACQLDEKRERLYVSLWGQAAVEVIDLRSFQAVARWAVQEHPNEMLLNKSGKLLYVANANRNTVTVLDTATGRTIETLIASMNPADFPGSTPNSLALSRDEKMLFVANACNNTVAVFDVTRAGRSRSLGFIPVGWYPTSVRVTPDGKKLLVANGKGSISKANPNGPQPGLRKPAGTVEEYIGKLFNGTVSVIDLASRSTFQKQLADYTIDALHGAPSDREPQAVGRSLGNPIPARLGEPSPIKYCIYVLKENRTYDQVLGDMPQGNGDPNLCLFPEKVTPNHHQIARDFVLLDNFYVESEVSADGHEWSMGAYATDFVEKTWPLNYGHNKSGKFPYPSEGHFAMATPASGYLWDRAREAGVSFRNYGEFIDVGKTLNDPATTRVPSLRGHFDPWFHPWDLNYPDVKRAEHFLDEIKRFEREGEMPRLQIVRLPNDHTYGTAAGKLTPTAMVAENDLAFGKFVEGISRSKFWPQTAIFVVEDDAQNGPDHVDAHRTIAFVVSPYAKRAAVDSRMYSTSSMLHTIELILGLQPMTQFDAAALPMYNSFQRTPDLRPYTALPAQVDLNEHNGKTAWGGKLSDKMDFTKEDAADDLLLNEIVWRSVRGADHPMPAPVRAAFVFAREEADD